MQTIKYIFLLALFLASSKIGKMLSQKYSYRVEELEEIKNGLNMEEDKVDSYGIKLEYDENGLLNRIILTLEKEEQSPWFFSEKLW